MIKTKKLLSLILALVFAVIPCTLLSTVFAEAAADRWVAAWGTSPVNGSVSVSGLAFQDFIPAKSTIRTELTVTTAGSSLKLHFSNQYGASAVTLSEVGLARTDGSGKARIVNGTQNIVTFGGKRAVSIPAGGDVWSDEIAIATSAMEILSISIYFENLTYITTTGLSNGRTFLGSRNLIPSTTPSKVDYISLGSSNEINISSGTITYHTIPFLCDVNTYSTSASPATAVFIGDSTLVNETYLFYAQKLINAGKTNVGIINEAVIGNKLLSNGTGLIGNLYGEAMVNRFNRDVLQKPNVKYVFVKIGLNDILHQFAKSMTNSVPHYTTDEIIAGYQSLIDTAHKNDIKIYFFTKSAWKGYERSFLGQSGDLTWNQEAQNMCDTLDVWVKSDNGADGFIDCSPLADPSDTAKLCSTFTLDGAHLTTLGAVALADLIPTEFLGVNSTGILTAAQLNSVDPYEEKNQIIADMNKPKEEPASSADNSTTPSQAPANDTDTETPANEVTTTPAAETTTSAPVVAPVTEVPSTYNYIEPSSVTPATTVNSNNIKTGNNQNIKFQVQNISPETTKTNTSLIYIFVLFSAAVIAATLVILTVGRRKEAEI